MNTLSGASRPSHLLVRSSLRGLSLAIAIGLFPLCLLAQDNPPPAPGGDAPPPPPAADQGGLNGAPPSDAAQTSDANGNGNGNGNRRSETRADGTPRHNFDPDAMMASLRKRLEVTDDAEWSVISARITAVFQARRAAGGFGGGMRMGAGGDGANANRPQVAGAAETAALRDAITNKLPDAEIKARLEKVRAVRKDNEAKLDKAREDLRAVLSVRQEAMLVMMGFLN